MMGITDVRKQLVVWSVAICVPWGIAGTGIALLNLIFGAGGTLLDPLLPACTLAVILLYTMKRSGS
jgi:hypothetical protein